MSKQVLAFFVIFAAACAPTASYVDTKMVCYNVGRAADTMGMALDESSRDQSTPPRVKMLMLTATQYAAEAHDACFDDVPAPQEK